MGLFSRTEKSSLTFLPLDYGSREKRESDYLSNPACRVGAIEPACPLALTLRGL